MIEAYKHSLNPKIIGFILAKAALLTIPFAAFRKRPVEDKSMLK